MYPRWRLPRLLEPPVLALGEARARRGHEALNSIRPTTQLRLRGDAADELAADPRHARAAQFRDLLGGVGLHLGRFADAGRSVSLTSIRHRLLHLQLTSCNQHRFPRSFTTSSISSVTAALQHSPCAPPPQYESTAPYSVTASTRLSWSGQWTRAHHQPAAASVLALGAARHPSVQPIADCTSFTVAYLPWCTE